MATASTTFTFTALTKAQAGQVNQNFADLVTFLNNSVVHVDGSKSMTNLLTLPASDPTNANHAARKFYVDKLGYVDFDTATSNQGSITTVVDLTGLTTTFTAEASRRYKLTAYALFTSTVAGDDATLYITNAANTVQGQAQVNIVNTGVGFGVIAMAVVQPGAGSVTYKARAARTFGSGTLTSNATAAQPAFLLVEDLGL